MTRAPVGTWLALAVILAYSVSNAIPAIVGSGVALVAAVVLWRFEQAADQDSVIDGEYRALCDEEAEE